MARSVIAGASGSVVHFLFMYLKSAIGLLPEFQPYHSFQVELSNWLGTNVPPLDRAGLVPAPTAGGVDAS